MLWEDLWSVVAIREFFSIAFFASENEHKCGMGTAAFWLFTAVIWVIG